MSTNTGVLAEAVPEERGEPSDPHEGGWLAAALAHAAHSLPAQAPLEVFVHHNTLHAFQGLPFHEALEAARAKLGAEGYWPESRYRAAFRAGRITERDLDAALARWAPVDLPELPRTLPDARAIAKLALLHDIGAETRAGLAFRLGEHRAGKRFASGVSAIARDRIERETVRWLRGELDRKGPIATARLLVGDEVDAQAVPVAFAESFGRPPTPERLLAVLDQQREDVAVASLWQACRAVSARVRASVAPRSPERPSYPRDALLAVGHDDPHDLVHPVLVALAGAFLDRGQSHWSMPDREAGFFAAFCRVLGAGRAIRASWLATLGDRLRAWTARGTTAEEAVGELLDELGVGAAERDAFVERTLLALPGFAGMFHVLESAPGPIGRSPARVRLVDFLAVRLTLDLLALTDVARRLGHEGPAAGVRAFAASLPRIDEGDGGPSGEHDTAWPLFVLAQHAGVAAPDVRAFGAEVAADLLRVLGKFDRRGHLRVWQEAFEAHYRDDVLRALSAQRAARVARPEPSAAARFQVLVCMDDRSESLRRHLEELSPAHATFGAAGFFNLAIAYQGIDDPSTFPLCPVVVKPQHRIVEEPVAEHAGLAEARRRRRHWFGALVAAFQRASRSLVLGPLVTAATGLFAALPLLAAVFMPWLTSRLRRRVEALVFPAPKTRLTPARADDGDADGELLSGFTLDEKASRVASLLENVGLVRDFAPVVAILGHDSSSVNNPHFAAYSCGACGGRSGGPNARLFARMANRPEVRERLRARGIDVPERTVFVGGVHDTCADRVTLFDVDELPAASMPELQAVQSALDDACKRDAEERCRRFASAPQRPSPDAALQHVEARSVDLGEPRPELGHATNASCVVGRRALTRGVFLDRRAFLVSYDPTLDEGGAVLERLLAAVGPVGSGINLEYLFSTTDNERYGAGTKLPHNVTGLFGVMNGASSDLRTGLPRQMIEIHEPMRLLLVVEAKTELILAVARRQPVVRELVENEWVRLAAIDPDDGRVAVFDAATGFVPWTADALSVPVASSSREAYGGHDGFVAPVRVVPEARGAASEEVSGVA